MTRPSLTVLTNLPAMEPREFCRIYVARSPYDEEEHGYRTRCARALSQYLHVSERSICRHWGQGIDFSKCPSWAKRQLRYLHLLAQQDVA